MSIWSQSSNAPTLQRACLNRVNSELTLFLNPGVDPCGNFLYYRLWGRTDDISEYELLDQSTNYNLVVWNVLLPNRKKWELYVSAHYSCGGLDSFASNFIFIDDIAPSYVEPDSISVDLATQKIIAGWSFPPETDIMGYSLFRVDGTGNNMLIDEQNSLYYTFELVDFNSAVAGNRLAIAAYDSCKNGGVISAFHSPVLLSITTSTDYLCDKGLSINWTSYVGWVVEEYELFVFDKDKATLLLNTRVSGNQLNYNYTLPYLGMQIDVYVRAHKQGGGVSSTSNKITRFISDFPKPLKGTSLYFASVDGDRSISLEGYVQAGDSFHVFYAPMIGGPWLSSYSQKASTGLFRYKHVINDTRTEAVHFKLVRYNSCGENADSSLIIKTIHLKNNSRELDWNDNIQWGLLSVSAEYIIETKTTGNWAELDRTWNTQYTLEPFGSYWIRVKGVCNLWDVEGKGYSYSNPIFVDLGFDSSLMDTLLIPNVFSPEGNNPIFRISNPAISLGESTLKIYNRWGEKIWEGDALEGWDGRVNGEVVSDGHYVYHLVGLYRRKRIEKAGMVLLLR
jgi:hypothetical protein